MIAVVDSGVANFASVLSALGRLGVEAAVTSDAGRIRAAERVILPGVGSARAAMAYLRERDFVTFCDLSISRCSAYVLGCSFSSQARPRGTRRLCDALTSFRAT